MNGFRRQSADGQVSLDGGHDQAHMALVAKDVKEALLKAEGRETEKHL